MSPVPVHNKEDPNKDEDTQDVSCLETPQFVVPGSSDSDEEGDDEHSHQGYQLLPQDPGSELAEPECLPDCPLEEPPAQMFDNVIMSSLEAQDYINGGATSGLFDLPGGADEEEERREVWSRSEPRVNEPLDEAKADQIRAAMAGFTLPAPDWAKKIPEDEWKAKLISRVHKTSPTSPDEPGH